MSLKVYKEKRNFNKSPEPRSGIKKKSKNLTFVIHRHDATRLHYDLRLEMDGVLKSWAVPKGPSLVTADKRLAIMVEDHPLEYGKFYGQIPEGNYGAGKVEILDRGTYKPMVEKGNKEENLLAQLKKGDLKFVLNGTYLKGAFVLVRINDEKSEWLLIKKEDEYARHNFNIEKLQPLKTAGTEDKKPSSDKPRKRDTFPSSLPLPMLARLSKEVMDNPDWIYEMKLDGYRMICSINDGQVEMGSRNGNSFTKKYGPLAEELKKIKDKVILDGEMIIEDSKGISNFQLLQNYTTTHKGKLKYYVFDLLYLNGYSITDFPLLKRKELLDEFFKKYRFRNIYNLKYQIGKGKELYNKLSTSGYEGVIAKAPESVYVPGKRSDSWLKVKSNMMQEAVICGYTLPQNSRKYFGSLILGLYEKGTLKYIGNCGTGFNEVSLRELHEQFEKIKTAKCPFSPEPRLVGSKGRPVWMKPELVCNVKFLEWSDDEKLRAPVFMGLREDKDAFEVINESKNIQPSEIKEAVKENKRNKSNKSRMKEDKPDPESGVATKKITISGKKVNLTNLTKIYWPGEGISKGDLINYYQSISKFILPYLKDRPQSLNRHPNGITGKSFYHKDMDVAQLPEWVRTTRIFSKSNDDDIEYLLCNDAATLIFMANLGCIEINPWHSTYLKPDEPTYMMLDLDPGNVISFIDVVNTALVIKEICDEAKIPCYCKTSGATGLHVYMPLGAKFSYDQVLKLAEILAAITHNRLPDTTSIERSVSKRNNRVYVDFLQNRKGQTIAAPYSVRPRAMATVSTPLEWKEVNHQLTPEMFTIKNILKRLEKTGDLWQPVLKKGVSLDTALKNIEKLL